MGEKNDYITWKVVWSYLLLLLTAVCSVWYIYTILQQLAVDDSPETSNREKIYLVTNTLSLIYESEALGQLVGMPNKDYRNFNRTIKQAHRNLDSLRFLLTDSTQQLKLDTIQDLLKRKRWNTLKLIETLDEWNAGQIYFENIEKVIAIQETIEVRKDSIRITPPVIHEVIDVQQDTVLVLKKKKGFFKRLAEAFSHKNMVDTSIVVNTTRQIVADTVKVAYNPADTIVRVLRSLQDTVAFKRRQLADELLHRAANLRYSNSVISSKINQMLRDIEEEEVDDSFVRVRHKQELLKETTRTIATIGLVAVFIAIIFLVIIIRDISKSHYYRKQLEKAKLYAEGLLRGREKLILMISHDIRAPLSSIIGYIELLQHRHPDERSAYYLDNMSGSSQHILSLVNDLLDFHRLESGQVELHFVPFQVDTFMKEIYDSFRPIAGAKGLDLELDIQMDERGYSYICDIIRLRQIISNLLSNAIKFTQEGKIVIRVSVRNIHLKMYQLDITISDAGPGIPESEQERVFGDFTRLNDAEQVEGYGLGLSITRRLVKLLKGTLRLHSVVGKGSDFIVSLPLRISDVEVKPVVEINQPDKILPVTEERVVYCLLVDDDAIQLALTEELLKQSHVEVVCVSNPFAVLDILKNTAFDVIISDIQMPGTDGYHLLEMIPKSGIPGTDKVPVIALSASVAKDHNHYIEAGFTGFINKPFTAEQLIELLNKLLTTHLKPVAHIDFTQLTAFAGGDKEASISILYTFIEETTKSIALLNTCLQEGNRAEAARIAHKLIPLLTMMGANHLVQKLRILEKNDDELTDEGWHKLLDEVIGNVSEIVCQAKQHYNDESDCVSGE